MLLVQNRIARYVLAMAMVAGAFAARLCLVPLTGTDTPFVFFLAAIMVTSLLAGVGPGIFALLLSLPLGAHWFVNRAGYPVSQAVFQSLLFVVEGLVVVYVAFLMRRDREAAQAANRQLRHANEEVSRAEARTHELLELAPDAFFQADLSGRFTDVNQAACVLLGYSRDELVSKTIFDVIPEEDAARLRAVRDKLLVPGRVDRAEWIHKRKDGTPVPLEVSANILPDGRWQAFARDISERRRIEDERQVFVSFLENCSDRFTASARGRLKMAGRLAAACSLAVEASIGCARMVREGSMTSPPARERPGSTFGRSARASSASMAPIIALACRLLGLRASTAASSAFASGRSFWLRHQRASFICSSGSRSGTCASLY